MSSMAGRDFDSEQELKKFIDTEVETLHPPKTSAFIFRVPEELRNGNGPFFEPKTISIGPLHAHNAKLASAKDMKKWYLKAFLSRLQQAQKSKEQLIQLLSTLESKTRECYKDIPRTITSYDFLEIMLLDGCFIVELLLRHNWQQITQDSVLGKEKKVPLYTLQQDLLKIENQFPFFVLHSLSQLVPLGTNDGDHALVNAALEFFRIPKPSGKTPDRPRHLLELVMLAYFPNIQNPSLQPGIPIHSPDMPPSSLNKAKSASELELYGIKFKQGSTTNLAGIKFNNGVLSVPCLEIDEGTQSLFWNFIIFEMCSCENKTFASYVLLMDTLVDNEKDIELLLQSGVLKSRINDKQKLVSLFNSLSANVQEKDFYFDSHLRQVNKYCDSDIRPLRAYLVRNYYDVRWDVLNSVLLFILTVTQTLFSILAYDPKQK